MIGKIFLGWAPLSKVVSDGSLVEPFSFVEELSNVFWSVSEQLILHQKHDALHKGKQSVTKGLGLNKGSWRAPVGNVKEGHLLRIHVELFPSHCHMSAFLQCFAAG